MNETENQINDRLYSQIAERADRNGAERSDYGVPGKPGICKVPGDPCQGA